MKKNNSDSWGVIGLWLTFLGTVIIIGSIWNSEMLNTGIMVLCLGVAMSLFGLIF